MLYEEYLLSPWWKNYRKEKLASVGYACEMRGDGDCNGPLGAHHLRYVDCFGNSILGKESLSDTEILCQTHHEREHNISPLQDYEKKIFNYINSQKNIEPPTEKQINYLQYLGYREIPKTKKEASQIIDNLLKRKAG